MNTCSYIKPDGRCGARPMCGRDLCCFHSPDMVETCREARRRGGKVNRKPTTLPPTTPDAPLTSAPDVAAFLASTTNRTTRGEIDCRVANAVSCLPGQLLRALEGGDLERRLERLEDLLSGKHNRRTA